MEGPDWLGVADQTASVVGAVAGVIGLVLAVAQRPGAGRSSTAGTESTVRPIRWRSAAMGAAAVIAGTSTAFGVFVGPVRWIVSVAALVLGVAATARLILLARRPIIRSPELRKLLTRQWEDANRHAYQFFDGHAPAVPKIYVEQLVELTGAGLLVGQAGVPGLLSVREALARADIFRHVLVVSGPGMGKSTLVAQILHEQCRWWLDARRGSRPAGAPLGAVVPIALPARLLAERSLATALAEVCGAGSDGLADTIQNGPPAPGASWLILVDGLDEVLSPHERSAMINTLGGWLCDAAADRRFLVTTRPLSYGELADVRPNGVGEFTLRPFSRADLRTFAENWFGGDRAGLFLSQVSSARLGTVVSVPLLATIAALVFELDRTSGLPTSRAGLYETFVQHLVEGRPAVRAQRDRLRQEFERYGAHGARAWAWLVDNLRPLLAHLADAHLTDPDSAQPSPAPRASIEARAHEWIAGHLPGRSIDAVAGWKGHVKTLLTSTGVLTLYDGRLAFTHRSLAEYLAAGVRGSSFSLAAWLADVRRPDTRNLALFVLFHSTEDIDRLVTDLLDGLGDDVIVAGDILADGIEVGALLRERVHDTLVRHLTTEEPTAPEALRVLVDLTADERVRSRLEALVRQEDVGPWVRVLVAANLDQIEGRRADRLRALAADGSVAPDARRWAFEQLRVAGEEVPDGAWGETPQAGSVSSALAWHALRQVHDNRRGRSDYEVVVALALAGAGVPGTAEALHGYLTDGGRRIDLRLEVARALLLLDGDRWNGPLRTLTDDAGLAVDVRVPAAVALAEHRDHTAEQALRVMAAADPTIVERLPAVRVVLTAIEEESTGRSTTDAVVGGAPPGAGPPRIWAGVPPRNRDFTGRHEELDQLRASLDTNGFVAALHGIGGVGKTQLAIEYAYRFADDYDVVCWIPAEQPPFVLAALESLAGRLDLPVRSDRRETAAAVFDAVRTRGRYLFVYDNAGSPDDLRALMPAGDGHVIVTSRSHLWEAAARTVRVDVFSRPESLGLLRRRVSGIVDADAAGLAERLGDLPLALEQAAAWLSTTAMPVAEYLDLLEDRVTELLSEGSPASYPSSVASSFRLAFDGLRAQNPSAVEVMNLFAFLGPEPISVNLLRRGRAADVRPSLRDTLSDPIGLSRVVRDLRRYALVTVDAGQRVAVHRLVRAVLRDSMTEEEAARVREEVQQILAAADPGEPEEPATWDMHAEIGPHVEPAGLIDADSNGARSVALHQSRYRFLIGDYENAKHLGEAMVAAWRRGSGNGLGPDGWMTLTAMGQLADAVRELGDHRHAGDIARAVFESLSRNPDFGARHELTLSAGGTLGRDLRLAGDVRAALAADRDSVEGHREVFGDDAQATLRARGNLAVSLRAAGDLAGALALSEETVDTWREVLGPTDVRTLSAEAGLADVLCALGRYDVALDILRAGLPALTAKLGRQHGAVLLAERTVAMASRKIGRHAEALGLAEANHEHVLRRFGAAHEHALAATATYANSLRVVGRLAEAHDMAGKAVDGYRRTFGVEHPMTLAADADLALILRAVGEAGQALDLDNATYEAMAHTLGPDHPYTLCVANNLANDLATLGRAEEAREVYARTCAASSRVCGEEHPYTLAGAVNLALAHPDGGTVTSAIARLGGVLGADHPEVLDATRGKPIDCDIEPLPN